MLQSLLSQSNYGSYNYDLVRKIGLTEACYFQILLDISEKALRKNKLIDNKYFNVSRSYITKLINIDTTKQHELDKIFSNYGLLEISSNSNNLYINETKYLELFNTDDRAIAETLADIKQEMTSAKRESKAEGMFKIIKNTNPELLAAYKEWISAVVGRLNKATVEQFENDIDTYCKCKNPETGEDCHDINKAIDLITIATENKLIKAGVALNKYLTDKKKTTLTTEPLPIRCGQHGTISLTQEEFNELKQLKDKNGNPLYKEVIQLLDEYNFTNPGYNYATGLEGINNYLLKKGKPIHNPALYGVRKTTSDTQQVI